MKIIPGSKTIISLLITFFLFGGVQQQINGMEVEKEVTIVLKDDEISVEKRLLEKLAECSDTVKHMNIFNNRKKLESTTEEDICLDITKSQWDLLEPLLDLSQKSWIYKKEVMDKIQSLTLKQLIDLFNAVNYLAIENLFEILPDVLAQYIQKNLDFCYDSELKNLPLDLRCLVAQKLLSIHCGDNSLYKDVMYVPTDNTHSAEWASKHMYPVKVWSPNGKYHACINMVYEYVGTKGLHICTNILEVSIYSTDNKFQKTLPLKNKHIIVIAWLPPGNKTMAIVIKNNSFTDDNIDDNIIEIWDIDSGTKIKTIELKNQNKKKNTYISAIAFSPNGKLMAASYYNEKVNILNILNINDEKIISSTELTSSENVIKVMSFLPNSQQIAIGFLYGKVIILYRLKRIIIPQKDCGGVIAIDWLENGKYFAIIYNNKTVKTYKIIKSVSNKIKIICNIIKANRNLTILEALVILKVIHNKSLNDSLKIGDKTVNELEMFAQLNKNAN